MAATRAVLREADTAVRRIAQRMRTAGPAARRRLVQARTILDRIRRLARRVLHQTRARVLHGDTHVPDKVLSVFEPHTEAIRKGQVAKPTEFGKLVTIQEAEGQIVSAYAVHARRPADRTLWRGALDVHQQLFGRSPARCAHERQRWFRRGQRWRVGSEERISVFKRRHGLHRCPYHGPHGTDRWVGLSVIAGNLLTIASRTGAGA